MVPRHRVSGNGQSDDPPQTPRGHVRAVESGKVAVRRSAANSFRSTLPAQSGAGRRGRRSEARTTDGALHDTLPGSSAEVWADDHAAAVAASDCAHAHLSNTNSGMRRPRGVDGRVRDPQRGGSATIGRRGMLPPDAEGHASRPTTTSPAAEGRRYDLIARRDCRPDGSEGAFSVDHRHYDGNRPHREASEQGFRRAERVRVEPPAALSSKVGAETSFGSSEGKVEGPHRVKHRVRRGAQPQPQPQPPPPPQKPPGFVVHAEAVFRWLGVEGLTPEVLRRAKRGMREEQVADKMWRALLRVVLLHLDATKTISTPGTPVVEVEQLGSVPNTPAAYGVASGKEAIPRSSLRSASARKPNEGVVEERVSGRSKTNNKGQDGAGRTEKRLSSGENTSFPTEEGVASVVPVRVAMETCGHLLPLWGYRRTAFIQGIKTGDALQTREVLLALSWMMAEARVFHAYEQACLISPISVSRPHQQHPLPFPKEPSDTPDSAGRARDAFEGFIREKACTSDWGGDGGKQEAVRMGEAGFKGERLARALGAAREIMSEYGRLEGELRIIESLEAGREKMLMRIQHLHREISEVQPICVHSPRSPPTGRGTTTTSNHHHHHSQHHHHQPQRRPSSATADAARAPLPSPPAEVTKATRPAASTPILIKRGPPRKQSKNLSPFCLCLLANKSAEELARSLSTVTRARAALEELEESWAHAGRWCRWVSSALDEAPAVPRTSGGGGGGAGDGDGDGDGAGESEGREEGGLDDLMLRWRGTASQLDSPRALQEELERRLTEVRAPSTPAVRGVPSMLVVEDEGLSPEQGILRSLADRGDDLGGVLRRAAREIDQRVGGKVLISELEAQKRLRERRRQQPQRGERRNPRRALASNAEEAPGRRRDRGDGEGYLRRHSASPTFTSAIQGEEVKAVGLEKEMEGTDELERSRKAHRQRLEELLSAFVGAMPFEPRGRGW